MTNLKYWITLILSVIFLSANAQNYSAGLIPDSLKENAHAVIREYVKEFELQGVNKGTDRIRKIITVLDNNGDYAANLNVPYNKDSKVTIYEAAIYDKNGKRVKKIKQSEISDSPVQDGVTLYSDNRSMSYRPSYGEYPYTMEYEYETTYSDLISYGSWYPVYGYNISLEHAKFTFIHPPEVQYRKKEINISSETKSITQGNKIGEKWEFSNIKAIEDEPFDISLSERLPKVYLMPLKLIFDNYEGASNDWKDYGRWIYHLYNGRDKIAEAEKIKISGILENIQDTIQKVKSLYEYMQEHTRYIGIQLGIGGFQPIEAQTVFETGYGDCKALVNYMHSLLKQAGIISYPALVSSGVYIEPIYIDFPNFLQFDHVILCVPFKRDTIWLECTNQTMPFGFLGDFTDDRDVLLLTDEGGKMVHTRRYGAGDNLRTCRAEFVIDPKGDSNCRIVTRYQCLQYNDIYELFISNPDEQKKWLYKNSTLPSPQLTAFNINNSRGMMPSAVIDESMISKNYCSFAGSYLLMPLNLINVLEPVKKIIKERRSDFILHRASTDYDTLIYRIPAEYKIESVPEAKIIKSAFGDYTNSVSVIDKKIVFSRKFVINQGRFKASEYKKFYEFCLSVSKADNEKVILVKSKN